MLDMGDQKTWAKTSLEPWVLRVNSWARARH